MTEAGRRCPTAMSSASSTSSVRRWSAHRPPHHPAAEHIEHDGQIQEPRRARDVGDVGDPQPVRPLGLEATLDEVRRRAGLGRSTRGPRPFAPGSHRPSPPRASPEPPACGSPACLSGQLGANPRRSVRPTAALVNRPYTRAQRLVRCLSRRALALAPRIEPARGDTEHSGHRGNAKFGLIRSHEPVDLPGTVS